MTGPACRNCGNPNLETVLDFGAMALANALLTSDQLDAPEPRYPLALAFCSTCYLAQITHVVAPELLFRDYAYFSSVSDAMVEHARRLVDRVAGSRELGPDSLVVEIASNDGYLLQHYVNRGIPVLGIDPARNIAEAATARGIPTLAEFFGVDVAESLCADGKTADVVHANNVLAHVPDIHGFLAGIATILKPGGIAVFETPYVRDLVDRLEFDTIYHEHVFYYSLSSIVELMSRHGLAVVDVERLAIHGGSLRVTVGHDRAATPAPAVGELLAEEERIGLRSVESFRGFADRVHALGDELTATLAGLKTDGQSIAAYGAAAKGAVLLNAFGIDAGTIDFVADRSPHKAGRFMPGVRIPVVSADRLGASRPDVCLLLTWNFADEILEQQAAYRAAGGRFLIPVPELRWA
jgi:SAM-dependent methyltransferase